MSTPGLNRAMVSWIKTSLTPCIFSPLPDWSGSSSYCSTGVSRTPSTICRRRPSLRLTRPDSSCRRVSRTPPPCEPASRWVTAQAAAPPHVDLWVDTLEADVFSLLGSFLPFPMFLRSWMPVCRQRRHTQTHCRPSCGRARLGRV